MLSVLKRREKNVVFNKKAIKLKAKKHDSKKLGTVLILNAV